MRIFDFKNKNILITAGSKGIGFELALQFSKYGGNVAITSRNLSNLKKAKEKIYLETNKDILFIKHDLKNINDIKRLFVKFKKHYKSTVDILINNSGGPPPKAIVETTENNWNEALNINLKSSIFSSIESVKNMKKKNWGRIINLTSSTAKEPAQNMCLSNVTRSALASFGKTLSVEVARYGITVNTILTGGVLTERLKNLIKLRIGNSDLKLDKELKRISNNIPVGKIASPEEFVQLILFLASENSSYVTGTSIPIDGGTSKSLF